eukprot:TRINITY_DN2714_c0_g1_i2.p5 TRINITY_DN2714_c0_g1~~TRINITY_DN2714_c0_g1_i2.p5  ORF type:complete len:117 (-),score=1.31 TRINITY_DN2714_c0_g1_i2:565-915(-)
MCMHGVMMFLGVWGEATFPLFDSTPTTNFLSSQLSMYEDFQTYYAVNFVQKLDDKQMLLFQQISTTKYVRFVIHSLMFVPFCQRTYLTNVIEIVEIACVRKDCSIDIVNRYEKQSQ